MDRRKRFGPIKPFPFGLQLVFVFFFSSLIYLTASGLSCSMWDLQTLLWHSGSLVAACEPLAAAYGV